MDEEISIEQVKEKLLKLSAKGLIKKTSFQIKKMNEQNCRIELEKYEQRIVAETVDKIKGLIFDGVSKGLSYMEVIDDEDSKKLENELKTNNYLEEEVINISKSIAPWIPYIGLTLAGITIGRYAYTRYLRQRKLEARDKKEQEAASATQEEINKNGTDRQSPERSYETERGVALTEP